MAEDYYIVDAQVHLWEAERHDRSWDPQRRHTAQMPQPLSPELLIPAMDHAGVDRAIVVPPSWVGDSNAYALEVAQHYPSRFAVMGRLDPNARGAAAALENWRDQFGMLGLRFTLSPEPWRSMLRAGDYDWVWETAQRLGIPIMVSVAGILPEVATIVERYPQLRLIVDHMGRLVGTRGPDGFADLSELLSLARYPNLAVKVSALPCFSLETYPFADLYDYIRRTYDAFGAQRLMWGTDYSRLPCSYEQAIDHFRLALDFLSDDDKSWIFARAAAHWLDWPLPR